LRNAVYAYRNDVGKNPPNISYLTTQPTAGTSTDKCVGTTNTLSAIQVAKWRGPYISRLNTGGDYIINDNETVEATLRVTSYQGGTVLQIWVDFVDYDVAVAVDARIDGDINGLTSTPVSSPTTGAVTYDGAALGSHTTLKYNIALPTGSC
jgi:hypothetical protein